MRFGQRILLLLLLPGLLLAVLISGVGELVILSVTNGSKLDLSHFTAFFDRADYVSALFRTIYISGITALICLVLGYPTAYFVARTPGRRDIFLILIIIPWILSLVVRTFGWIVLLGNRGIVNGFMMQIGLTVEPVKLMFNPIGVVIGLVHVFLPFMILAILPSLLHMDRAYEEAAMSLRANKWQTMRRVVMPLTLPGVISGVMLVYLMSTGAIVTPLMLGGVRDGMLGTQIYHEVINMANYAKAASIAVILAITAFAVVIPLQWLERHVSRNMRGAEE